MARGDNRKSRKVIQRRGQKKKKARLKRRAETAKTGRTSGKSAARA